MRIRRTSRYTINDHSPEKRISAGASDSFSRHIKTTLYNKRATAFKVFLCAAASFSVLLLTGCSDFTGMFEEGVSTNELLQQSISSYGDIEDSLDRLDYSALAAILGETYDVETCFLADSGANGRNGLFAVVDEMGDAGINRNSISMVFMPESGLMTATAHWGSAGDVFVRRASDDSVILEMGYYTSGYTSESLLRWNSSEWVPFANYAYSENMDGSDSGEWEIDGVACTKDEYNRRIDSLLPDRATSPFFPLTVNIGRADETEQIIEAYSAHLGSICPGAYTISSADFDNDSQIEHVIYLRDFLNVWKKNLTCCGSDTQVTEWVINNANKGSALIYVDTIEDRSVYQAYYLNDQSAGFDEINCDNNTLTIRCGSNRYVLFAPKDSPITNTPEEGALNDVCNRYAEFLTAYGYKDVMIKLYDVCSRPGKEVVCVMSDGQQYHVEVLCWYGGRLMRLYRFIENDRRSCLLTRCGEDDAILIYSQRITGSTIFYNYQILRFNEHCEPVVADELSTFVDTAGSTSDENRSFYKNSAIISNARRSAATDICLQATSG